MNKSRYINLYLPEDIVDKVDSIASKEEFHHKKDT